MARRIIMRIEVTPKARADVAKVTELFGMKQVAVMSRVIEWLSSQSDVVQANVLGLAPQALSTDIVPVILKAMLADHRR